MLKLITLFITSQLYVHIKLLSILMNYFLIAINNVHIVDTYWYCFIAQA